MKREKGVMCVFQGGKRKITKEHGQMLTEQIETYKKAVQKVSESSETALDILEEVEQEKIHFDRALTHVVDHVKQMREEEQIRIEREEDLLEQMTELLRAQQQGIRKYGQAMKCAEEERTQLLEIVEQNKHFTEPARIVNQEVKELGREAERLEDELLQMKEYARQMGVLSLNSAIEAGRMGETGRKFVAASEEVRNFSGKYQDATNEMIACIVEMKKRLSQTEEQVAYLTELMKENNKQMTKATTSFQTCVEQLTEADLKKEVTDCSTLLTEWKKAADITKNHGIYFEDTLGYMEQAGESFIKEQESMERLKEQWKRVQLEVSKTT